MGHPHNNHPCQVFDAWIHVTLDGSTEPEPGRPARLTDLVRIMQDARTTLVYKAGGGIARLSLLHLNGNREVITLTEVPG